MGRTVVQIGSLFLRTSGFVPWLYRLSCLLGRDSYPVVDVRGRPFRFGRTTDSLRGSGTTNSLLTRSPVPSLPVRTSATSRTHRGRLRRWHLLPGRSSNSLRSGGGCVSWRTTSCCLGLHAAGLVACSHAEFVLQGQQGASSDRTVLAEQTPYAIQRGTALRKTADCPGLVGRYTNAVQIVIRLQVR